METRKTELLEDGITEDFMWQAERAANIVSEGLEQGNYSHMINELNELTHEKDVKDTYIYEHENIIFPIFKMTICIIFSLWFIYFFLIGIGTATFSKYYFAYGVVSALCSIAIIIFNLIFFRKSFTYIKFCRRYDDYINILKYHSIEIIEDLAAYTGRKKETVIDDLQIAVEQNLIPEGHFGTDNMIFILTDATFTIYQDKQYAYDHYYREQIEERRRMNERAPEIQRILELGQEYIEKIHGYNDIIKDKEITKKLYRMEKIVSMIFHEIDINPDQAGRLRLFFNYYLPTTEKLLKAYIDINEKQTNNSNLSKARKQIEESIDTINSSFEELLNRFYQQQEMDVVVEISTMKMMMEQDGLV